MVPSQRYAEVAKRQFVEGEEYPLVVEEERSQATHRHYFAVINEIWKNLPDHLAKRFPTAEHLRAFALVREGFCDDKVLPCESPALAKRMAGLCRPLSPFSVIRVEDDVVHIHTPKSQSPAAMGREEFQRSKEAVLEFCASLIAVEVREVRRQVQGHAPREHREIAATGAQKALPPPARAAQEPPRTAAGYVAYLSQWLAAETDGDQAWARFDGEKEMRDALKIKVSERTRMRNQVFQKFAS